jgi:hypothetical protein
MELNINTTILLILFAIIFTAFGYMAGKKIGIRYGLEVSKEFTKDMMELITKGHEQELDDAHLIGYEEGQEGLRYCAFTDKIKKAQELIEKGYSTEVVNKMMDDWMSEGKQKVEN